ncbi:transposase family protein [Streptomyces sioyaensis]|uniref:transposase family protein n=1 Tax=Streptomyces sioyaensis TaxID=67364 RepID=UPI0033FFF6D7
MGLEKRGTTLVSGKHRDTGFNLQVAATLAGKLLTVSAPVPASRHDMHAWRQSEFSEAFAEREAIGDLELRRLRTAHSTAQAG